MINRRNLLKLLAFLPFTVREPNLLMPKKGDPWPFYPIGAIVKESSNIMRKLGDIRTNRAGHKWVRKFGVIPYPGTCDYYWERVE